MVSICNCNFYISLVFTFVSIVPRHTCISFLNIIHKFKEKMFTLQTREQHLLDCDALEIDKSDETSKELGINYRSILFELEHFSVDSLVPDVMHDILEGTLQCEAKLVLQHVVREKYISYASFSSALIGLELGYMEADNKPTEISLTTLNDNPNDKHLGQKGISNYVAHIISLHTHV